MLGFGGKGAKLGRLGRVRGLVEWARGAPWQPLSTAGEADMWLYHRQKWGCIGAPGRWGRQEEPLVLCGAMKELEP